jgi:hypothetical protein
MESKHTEKFTTQLLIISVNISSSREVESICFLWSTTVTEKAAAAKKHECATTEAILFAE